ncbi:uncharacterized protein KY384_002144 [Bacidia gigantensis]|uniref:uncharacterized protein n=1 Tax=Bacidia gigantensis TaxID=2732470 RepID=UPI001D03CF7A|nr:uncharacterized protein KY384_002144 [Bacidia gigantensis]KAG8533361.1 hypothetical protein KY384_002144 [Bacidia gigantensis]
MSESVHFETRSSKLVQGELAAQRKGWALILCLQIPRSYNYSRLDSDMASNPSQAQKSRWGNFLSSVESRLDTILTEDDPKAQTKPDATITEQPGKKETMAIPARPNSPAKPASSNRAQERLNEKLARAMANKNIAKKGDGSVLSSGVPSRTASPANVESSRSSVEVQREEDGIKDSRKDEIPMNMEQEATSGAQNDERKDTNEASASISVTAGPDETKVNGSNEDLHPPRSSTESREPKSRRQSPDMKDIIMLDESKVPHLNGRISSVDLHIPEGYERSIQQIQSDNEEAEIRRQEEAQEYLEKIDTLQAKLQYLTKEASEAARAASSNAETGSHEQKLAAKDEKIALLMEEGQKLSQTELKHMTVIKKLRAKSAEDDKSVVTSKQRVERQDQVAREAQERAKRAEASEKSIAEKLKGQSKLEKDLNSLRSDRDTKDLLIRDLQMQLSEATSAAKEAEETFRAEALETQRKLAADLSEEISNIKHEKELTEKEHQNVLRGIKDKGEREKERARVAEIERQGELNTLESRLEAYRSRAEEASAGQGGDVQAKLLRQIETLQNQYAVASENWQGIEGSLLSRVTTLEKERDEIARRETDIRRKARENNSKSRRMEEELERVTCTSQDLDSERAILTSQLNLLRDQLNKAESDVNSTRIELKAERESWETRQTQRLEEERLRIRDEFSRSVPGNLYTHIRNESPIVPNRPRKSSNAADRSSPHSRRVSSYQGLGLSGTSYSPNERPISRRSSTQPTFEGAEFRFAPTSRGLDRVDSMSTVPDISINNGIPETPSVDYDAQNVGADDDFFAGVHTPATPPERTVHDLVSISTAGAGPSVQLVERMSAAVRRLESEKAVLKDELARLAQQRDEAREQVVELMQDNAGKKAVDERVKVLERDFGDIKARHDTTLEMLGEKSERVEELKADIVDLKILLREMVEERVK